VFQRRIYSFKSVEKVNRPVEQKKRKKGVEKKKQSKAEKQKESERE